jgi:hypothetical protein
MKLTMLGAAAAAFAAVALAFAPVAAAGPEEDFLTVLSDGGLSWPSGTTQAIIDGGYGVCADWANGAEFADEVVDIVDATGWSEYDAGFFVGAATGAFCPEYEYKVS